MGNAYSIILIEKNDMKISKYFSYSDVKYVSQTLQEIYQHYNGMMGLWIIFSSFFQHSFVIFIINVVFFWKFLQIYFLKGKAVLVSRWIFQSGF